MLTPVTNGLTMPVDLDTGRVLAPGETGEADLDHPHNAALVGSAALVVTKPQKTLEESTVPELRDIAADLDIEGYGSMNKAELVAAIEAARAPAVEPDVEATTETEETT